MAEIKAIETVYNGYKFRSRLEARWAVFFDAMGIEYEYEPEGYVLQNGDTYLPDFLIYVKHRSQTDEWEPIYAEVKGILSPRDEAKCSEFSIVKPLILLGNLPGDINEYTEKFSSSNCFHSFTYIDADTWAAYFSKKGGIPIICTWEDDDFDGGESMNKALKIARQARFEHGEKPNFK